MNVDTQDEKQTEKLQEQFKLIGRETYGFPSNHTVYDCEGVGLKLCILDDKHAAPFGEKHFRKIRDLELKDNDILLCGYPKTGCHWIWEVLSMIRARKAEHSKTGKEISFLEFATLDMINSTPVPRILNTHVWFDYLPKQITEKKTKIILTTRNPKDTAVSYYNHHIRLKHILGYDGKFKNWFPLYMEGEVSYGSYWFYYNDYERAIKENPDVPVLVVSFEDMKENLPREIRRMSKFLEVDLDEDLVYDIAKTAGFDHMKKVYEENDIMSKGALRKGQVGDWKNWLTVAQSEAIDAKVEEEMRDSMFKSRCTKYTIS